MKYSKKLIIAASSAGVIGVAGISASAMAATTNSGSYPSIVQKIASTFNLDPSKVNDVFTQQRQANHAAKQAQLQSTLDQAVKDGKLTQDQETKLIAELASLRAARQTNKAQGQQTIKAQLEQWATDNGITNLSDILPQPAAGGHHGMMSGAGS